MAQNTIAIISDCDDTLGPDTTGQVLAHFGVAPNNFFLETADLVKQGWDPTLAYLYHMTELAKGDGPLAALTKEKFVEIGQGLQFYPGVPGCFSDLKREIEEDQRYRDVGIRVETYVVSSGIEELLAASPLQGVAHSIWGSSFAYDDQGRIAYPKRTISFTDKTRCIFLIQKGKVSVEQRNNPYVVNEPMELNERPVPFRNMIYIGDGASDIPCMSLIQTNEGYVIGILSQENPGITWALGYGRRANITVPPGYEAGGYAYEQLRQALVGRAEDIRRRLMDQRPVPRY